jgi:hypothetical protein
MRKPFAICAAAMLAAGVTFFGYDNSVLAADRGVQQQQYTAGVATEARVQTGVPQGITVKAATEREQIAELLANVTEGTFSDHGLQRLNRNLSEQDRARLDLDRAPIDEFVENSRQFRRIWQEKYGERFDIDATAAFGEQFQGFTVVQGEVQNPALLANWPVEHEYRRTQLQIQDPAQPRIHEDQLRIREDQDQMRIQERYRFEEQERIDIDRQQPGETRLDPAAEIDPTSPAPQPTVGERPGLAASVGGPGEPAYRVIPGERPQAYDRVEIEREVEVGVDRDTQLDAEWQLDRDARFELEREPQFEVEMERDRQFEIEMERDQQLRDQQLEIERQPQFDVEMERDQQFDVEMERDQQLDLTAEQQLEQERVDVHITRDRPDAPEHDAAVEIRISPEADVIIDPELEREDGLQRQLQTRDHLHHEQMEAEVDARLERDRDFQAEAEVRDDRLEPATGQFRQEGQLQVDTQWEQDRFRADVQRDADYPVGVDIYEQDQQIRAETRIEAERPLVRAPLHDLEQGAEVALVNFPAQRDLPSLTVSLVQANGDDWRLDLPNHLMTERLRDNLNSHLTYLINNQNLWPADQNEAARYVTHHLMAALYDVGVPAQPGQFQQQPGFQAQPGQGGAYQR